MTPPLRKPAGGKGSPAQGKSRGIKKQLNQTELNPTLLLNAPEKKNYSPHVLVTLDVMLLFPNIVTHCNNVVSLYEDIIHWRQRQNRYWNLPQMKVIYVSSQTTVTVKTDSVSFCGMEKKKKCLRGFCILLVS